MATLKVSDLSPHPKNNYYFDDVSGDKWNEFLESIRKNGVREQIIVTDDMVIVSGHQRVRACKELGIQVIDAKIEHYNSDDDVVRDLIEINTKQRGVISDSEIKIGRRIKFLEEYYGVQHGNNQHTERSGHNVNSKSQNDLAEELEMSKRQMARYKSLTELIPELQSAVENGQITATTAMGFVKKLSPEEQKKLAESISGQDKVSGKEVEKYVIELKAKDAEIERLTRNYEGLDRANKILAKEANQGGKVVEKVVEVEVAPSDYKEVKNKAKAYDAETKRLNDKLEEAYQKRNELESKIKALEEQTAKEQSNGDMVAGAIYFIAQCGSFIRDVGGYVWLADKIADLPARESEGYIKAAMAVRDWANVLIQNIERNEYGKQEVARINAESAE